MVQKNNRGGNKMKQKCEVYSRVVGYIRPVDNWNDSKQQEFKDRTTFKLK
jgi:anaerobic ribonucleoside-triphosphate reductase